MAISPHHPLRKLFEILVEKSFYECLGWPDPHIIRYVSGLLVEFTDMETVTRIKNTEGERRHEISDMLLEAEQGGWDGSRDRGEEAHRHIGDYTLFMMGIFPEYLNCLKSSGRIQQPDVLMDYAKVGRRSYKISSELAISRLDEIATLYKKLSEHFELCVLGLDYIRQDLNQLQVAPHQQARGILLN